MPRAASLQHRLHQRVHPSHVDDGPPVGTLDGQSAVLCSERAVADQVLQHRVHGGSKARTANTLHLHLYSQHPAANDCRGPQQLLQPAGGRCTLVTAYNFSATSNVYAADAWNDCHGHSRAPLLRLPLPCDKDATEESDLNRSEGNGSEQQAHAARAARLECPLLGLTLLDELLRLLRLPFQMQLPLRSTARWN